MTPMVSHCAGRGRGEPEPGVVPADTFQGLSPLWARCRCGRSGMFPAQPPIWNDQHNTRRPLRPLRLPRWYLDTSEISRASAALTVPAQGGRSPGRAQELGIRALGRPARPEPQAPEVVVAHEQQLAASISALRLPARTGATRRPINKQVASIVHPLVVGAVRPFVFRPAPAIRGRDQGVEAAAPRISEMRSLL